MTILPLVAVLLVAQAVPIDVGRDSAKSFAFDWTGAHEDGTPGAEVTEAEFQFVVPGDPAPPQIVRVPHSAVSGENRILVRSVLGSVPAGIYDLSVRLVDPGGQVSAYSTPVLALRVRVKNPDKPTNVRVVGN